MKHLDFKAPPGWWPVDQTATSLSWTTRHSDRVAVAYRPLPLSLAPDLLATYRQDLRWLAATLGGGLLSCELTPYGLAGAIKYPLEHGLAYRLHHLVPVAEGHLELTFMAAESVKTQPRSRLVAAPGPAADPYGFSYPPPPRFWQRPKHWLFPPRLTLYEPCDAAVHDKVCPAHPLSRVRALPKTFRGAFELCPAATGGLHSGAFLATIPEGFSPLPDAPLENCYVRPTFGGWQTLLALRRTDSPRRLAELVDEILWQDGDQAEFLWHDQEWGGAVRHQPWGDSHIELLCLTPRPAREQALALLETVAASLR